MLDIHDGHQSNVSVYDHNDPFSLNRKTRYIHFKSNNSLEKAALLSRYSRSQKSMIDLINTEFKDKDRAPAFMSKLLSEYGDDSVAELANETMGIEGLSLLAASKLTDQRIGISFLEKSTRYVPFTVDSFYIPGKIFDYGLVDEFQSLCGLSFRTFNKIKNQLETDYKEKYPIEKCYFYNAQEDKDVQYDHLLEGLELDSAEKAYNRAVLAKTFDIAGYSWLTSLKTNIGFNANGRALEHLISKGKQSRLGELNDISSNLYDILAKDIEPFIIRTNKIPIGDNKNPFSIYSHEESLISLYKHNIATCIRSYATTDGYSESTYDDEEDDEEDIGGNTNAMMASSDDLPTRKNILNSLLNDLMPSKIKFKQSKVNTLHTDSKMFDPDVGILSYLRERYCIDVLCSAILYGNDEILLEYDQKNVLNIDSSLRISTPDSSKIKQGILYDFINKHKTMKEMYSDEERCEISENVLSFGNIQDYWDSNRGVNDTPIYQDYDNPKVFTITKDQHFLINRYIGDRKSRRDKLGRAFELIHYLYEISSSFRIMREFKRHRLLNAIYPQLITTRDSYDSYIFPLDIIKNKALFDSYKNLISESFKLYSKIIDKTKDYVTAQYCLPLSVRTNYIANINLRELDYLLSLRSTPQAHPEFRMIAKDMYEMLRIIHPNLAKLCRFVDLKYYNLGRLQAEFHTQKKVNAL